MKQGAFGQYIIKNQNLNSFMPIYEHVLNEYKFYIKKKSWDRKILRHKAVFGSKAKAFAVSAFTPFHLGEIMEEGNRYGAEAEIYQYGSDVILRLLIVPYWTLADEREIFLLSQGLIEKMVDDKISRRKLDEIVGRLMVYRQQIYTF